MALVSDTGEYPLLEGDIGSTDGLRLDKHQYKNLTNEFIVEHSSAKHARCSRESYMVGRAGKVQPECRKTESSGKKSCR